jgi:hypothetical protein
MLPVRAIDTMMQEHTYPALMPRQCTGFVYNGTNTHTVPRTSPASPCPRLARRIP